MNNRYDPFEYDRFNKQQYIQINNKDHIEPEVKSDVSDLKPCVVKELSEFDSKKMINMSLLSNFIVNQFKQKECPDSIESPYSEVIFKCKRKRLFRNEYNIHIEISDFVIVEVENGIDIGTIYSCGTCAIERMKTNYKSQHPEYTIIRHATSADIELNKRNIEDEEYVVDRARDMIKRHGLDMKITEAEWQFDRQRLTVSFTAPQRIDFRELVKELARFFKTRIELRQISTREEAKLIGGLGSCGRTICCSSFSSDLCHVTLDHARTQQLSNNIAKLSGYCGRLKCCLLFEYPNYVEAFKKYPPLHSTIEFSEGTARIMKVDIFKDLIFLHFEAADTYKTIEYIELDELIRDGKVIPPAFEEQEQNNCLIHGMIEEELLKDEMIEEDLINEVGVMVEDPF